MKCVLLRFDAPLVSFGAPAVDQRGVIQAFPTLSMLTGLLANAIGWCHRDAERLAHLQDRLRFAARIDRRGEVLTDYQTVDLGADWMLPERAGWTTRGRVAERSGGSSGTTHQRYRQYRADSIHTVSLALEGDSQPDIDAIVDVLREPARPLFIGRKCCLPAAPILLGCVEAKSLLSAIASVPRAGRGDKGSLPAYWWENDDTPDPVVESQGVVVTDERDWKNRVHVGRRFMREGLVDPPEAGHV